MKSLSFSLFNLFGNSKSHKKRHHRTTKRQRYRGNHFNKRRGTRRNYKMRGG
jgi:hypothetical protein